MAAVQLYVYDISKGMARSMSQSLLGRQIDGIWHTSIVIFGQEYFFGSFGIDHCTPGCTILGTPDNIVDLGNTDLPADVFSDYLAGLAQDTFSGNKYHLLEHNCNTFSSEVSQFLTGNDIPETIRNLSSDVLNTPFGAAIRPLIDSMSISPATNQQPPQEQTSQELPAEQPASDTTNSGNNTAPTVTSSNTAPNPAPPPTTDVTKVVTQVDNPQMASAKPNEADTQQPDAAVPTNPTPAPAPGTAEGATATAGAEAEPQGAEALGATAEAGASGMSEDDELMARAAALIARPTRASGPRHKDFTPDGMKYEPKGGGPVFYLDIDYSAHYQSLRQGAMSMMSEEELHLLDELHEYLSNEDSIWAVSQEHMSLIGKLLLGDGLSPSIHLHVLRLLQLAVINFDVILMLKHDKENKFMTYVYDFDKYDKEIQIELGKVLCNICSNKTGVNWLLNIIVDYHLTDVTSQPNGIVITKIAVNMLLSDDLSMVEVGANLCLHFAVFQITYYTESSVDISFALLQSLSKDLPEPIAYHCLAALCGFLNVTSEVGEIIQVVGTDLSTHAKKSDRIMSVYEEICHKLNIPP